MGQAKPKPRDWPNWAPDILLPLSAPVPACHGSEFGQAAAHWIPAGSAAGNG